MKRAYPLLVAFLLFFLPGVGQTYYPLTQGFGVYLQTHLTTDSMLEALGQMGFNRMMLEPHNKHVKANQEGIAVELANWWPFDTDTSTIQNVFNTASQVSDLIGINMADEPFLNGYWNPIMGQHSYPASYYAGMLPSFRSQYPNIRLGFTLYGPWFDINNNHNLFPFITYANALMPYYQEIDMVRIMPYTYYYGYPHSQVVRMIEMSRQLIDSTGRDIAQTVVLQTWSDTDLTNPQFPSIPELRVQIYSVLLSGVEGVSFFTFNPEVYNKIPGFMTDFQNLIAETKTFAVNHADFYTTAWLDPTNSFLNAHLVSRYLPREDYCILVNLTNTFTAQHFLAPYEVRILSGGNCPWPLPADSLLPFLITANEPFQVGGEPDFELFPNPGKEKITLKSNIFDQSGAIRIQIIDLNGKIKGEWSSAESKLASDHIELDVADYAPGLYFIQVVTESGNFGKRFLVGGN